MGAAGNGTLTLENITVTNGFFVDAVFRLDRLESFTLRNCIISNHTVIRGPIIDFTGRKLVIENCRFEYNNPQDPGTDPVEINVAGIPSRATVEIRNTKVN